MAMKNTGKLFCAIVAALIFCVPAFSFDIDSLVPNQLQVGTAQSPGIARLIRHRPVPYDFLEMLPLEETKIIDLRSKSVFRLSINYFVVADNFPLSRMTEVYRYCQQSGYSTFVTADSILHPYFAFTNRVLAEAAGQMRPDLLALLQSMQQVSLADYRSAKDAEIRNDLERNIAYLAVAIKLLNWYYAPPEIGHVPALVQQELVLMRSGVPAPSAISSRAQDYSVFKPLGWYTSSDELKAFYRCCQWLSQVPYVVDDVATGSPGQQSNDFRRSVLLFRSLDRCQVDGKTGMEMWAKLSKGLALLGTCKDERDRLLNPADYKLVFQGKAAYLQANLNALADPLYRTKLMLSIRQKNANGLASTSVLDLESRAGDDDVARFHLFPSFEEAEMPWLRRLATMFPADPQAAQTWPVSLLDMYERGSPQAGNELYDNISALPPTLAPAIAALKGCVSTQLPNGQSQQRESRRWKLLSSYFRMPPATFGVADVLRTREWANHQLISAFSGFVDSLTAIAPPLPAEAQADKAAAGTSGSGSQLAGSRADNELPDDDPSLAPPPTESLLLYPERRSKPYHFLEPAKDLYQRMELDAQKMQSDLEAVHYFPSCYQAGFAEFINLLQRLQHIADFEIRGQRLSSADSSLLANFAEALDKVDVPLPAVLSFGGLEGNERHALNLAVGHPGLLFVIYRNPYTHQLTLGRGPVYTYAEMPAPLVTNVVWQRNLQTGYSYPPAWAGGFEMVQKPAHARSAGVVKTVSGQVQPNRSP